MCFSFTNLAFYYFFYFLSEFLITASCLCFLLSRIFRLLFYNRLHCKWGSVTQCISGSNKSCINSLLLCCCCCCVVVVGHQCCLSVFQNDFFVVLKRNSLKTMCLMHKNGKSWNVLEKKRFLLVMENYYIVTVHWYFGICTCSTAPSLSLTLFPVWVSLFGLFLAQWNVWLKKKCLDFINSF